MRANWVRLTPLLLFLGLSFFLYKGLSLDPHALPSTLIDKKIPSFKIPDLFHPKQNFTPKVLKGEMTLLNVFASWCDACLAEQVLLMRLHDEGIKIYGVNYKDNPDNAKQYLNRYGNPYVQVGSDLNGRVGIDLGVYGAPETFVINEKGQVLYKVAGILTDDIYQNKIKPLLKKEDKSS